MSRGRGASAYLRMPPGESSRLVIACTTLGFTSCCSALMIVPGTPMPVMPHAPMRPRRCRSSNAGNDLFDVLAPRRREAGALVVAVRVDGVVFADVAVQEVDVDVIEAHGREARVERRLELRRHRPDARGSPSWHFVVMRTPAGSAPWNAEPITASQAPYIGAVSITLMPAASAAWTVATASSSLDSPQICPSPPPPSVKRLTSSNGPSFECCIV